MMLKEATGFHTFFDIAVRPVSLNSINILQTFPHGTSTPAMHLYNSHVLFILQYRVQINMVIKPTQIEQ